MNVLDAQAEDTKFDMQKLFFCYTFDVICDIAFGQDVDTINNPEHPFANAFDSVNGICSWRLFLHPVIWKTQRFFKLGQEKDVPRYIETMRKTINKFVVDALEADEDALDQDTHVLALAIKALRKDKNGKNEFNQEISVAYLTDLANTFIIAGRGLLTLSLSLLCLYLLSIYLSVCHDTCCVV